MSDHAARPGHDRTVWRSTDVEAWRGFAYYRDGICQSFMDLIPEPDGGRDWAFSGSVDSIAIGSGRLNKVVATSHLVLRTQAEIARAPLECFYLNYKTFGECRIRQSGDEVVLRPGDVGIFESTRPFALEHRRVPTLAVSSFMLPFADLRERLPHDFPAAPSLLSRHPAFGNVVRELAATIDREIDTMASDDGTRLFEMLLDLVAMALSSRARPTADTSSRRADAHVIAAKAFMRDHCAQRDLDANAVAGALGISVRYLHQVFERTGKTVGEHLLERRLDAVASALRSAANARVPIAALASRSGFSDPAYFYKVFKQRFGCTAGEWRHGLPVRAADRRRDKPKSM